VPARNESDATTPWLTPVEAAARAKCSRKLIYHAVKSGKLKAARLGIRNDIRIREDWLDAWMTSTANLVNPDAPGENAGPLTFTRLRPRGR